MTKDEDFKLLKIQTCVLKVNIHCDGCKQKVKKILQRIEGVFQVKVDADQQKVTVSGSVDSTTLIKKLVRSGKHAELWSQKGTQNSKQKSNLVEKDDKNNKGQKQGQINGFEPFKNHKFPILSAEEDDFDCLDDDYEDDDEDAFDELRLLEEKVNQMGILRGNAKNGVKAIAGNSRGNGNAGKKGNPNQNLGIKANLGGGMDQKAMSALKLNNAQLGAGKINGGDGVRLGNDINSLMGIAGFNGKGPNVNSNGLGGFQFHPNSGIQGSSNGGFPTDGHYHHPSNMGMNMNGFQQYNHPSSMMNLQNRQPQMMYHRAPYIPSNTGYYYNYNYSPVPHTYIDPNQSGNQSATHMFSDENTGSCSIM